MLPIPVLKYFPKLFQSDAKAVTLANKIDDHLEDWKTDVLNLKRFFRPDETPSITLIELGNMVNAGIESDDSDAVKRQKIYNAVKSHKKHGTWIDDARLKIYSVTGVMPLLYTIPISESDDNIRLAKEASDPDTYWSTRGIIDGVDTFLGEWRVGIWDEVVIAGNIYIDLVSNSVTSDELDEIEYQLLSDCFAAYYRGYLGYVSGGVWTSYGRIIN